jgi:predicted nucleotidyltransferase
MTPKNNLAKSIYSSLAYSDIFEYPLTREEITGWLIGGRGLKSVIQKDIDKKLQALVKKKMIGKKGIYYYIKGRAKIARTRKEREKWSNAKIIIAENVAVILRKITWVKLIGITGGVARKNAKKEDDIDLLFIVNENRLWLTRAIIVLILKLLGRYRRPDKYADMICPNMFVAENSLSMKPQDLYTAHEIFLLKPLYVKDNIDHKFYQNNPWTKNFLPRKYGMVKSQKIRLKNNYKKYWPKSISLFWDYLEKEARNFQLLYMNQKKTTEIVSKELIKFHPRDMRSSVLAAFKDRLKNWR